MQTDHKQLQILYEKSVLNVKIMNITMIRKFTVMSDNFWYCKYILMQTMDMNRSLCSILTTLINSLLYLQSGVPFSSYTRDKDRLPPIQPR
jgi:hypothetical protein